MRRKAVWLLLLAPLVVPMAALALATLTASPSSLSFVDRCVRTLSGARTVTVKNESGSGATGVHVSISPSVAAQVFPLAGTTAISSLGPNRSVSFRVAFEPQRAGPTNAAAIITYTSKGEQSTKKPTPDSTTRTTSVALSGGGIDRFVDTAPHALNFGSTRVGRAVPSQSIRIYDDGSTPLTVTSIGLAGRHPGDFKLSRTGPFTVTDGSPETISVGFTPRGVGARAAELIVRTNGCDNPTATVALAGIGIEQDIAARPDKLDLGDVLIDEYATSDISVVNQGQAPLRVTGLRLVGKDRAFFRLSNVPSLPRTLGAGRSLIFTVRFTAKDLGARLASIHVDSNDPDHKRLNIELMGEGIIPTASPTPTLSVSVAPSVAPSTPEDKRGLGIRLQPYLSEIFVGALVLAFFGTLVTIRRLRGIPE